MTERQRGNDKNGTVTSTIDTSTNTPVRRYFDPFGGTRGAASTWIDPNTYLNKPTNSTLGTTHVGARDYDPTLGKFLSVDPVLDTKDPLQDTGYSYAVNNPITSADPTGLHTDDPRYGVKDTPDGYINIGDAGNGAGYVPPPSSTQTSGGADAGSSTQCPGLGCRQKSTGRCLSLSCGVARQAPAIGEPGSGYHWDCSYGPGYGCHITGDGLVGWDPVSDSVPNIMLMGKSRGDSGKPDVITGDEQAAADAKAAGPPYDQKAFKSWQRKTNTNQKLGNNPTRNKQKSRGQYQSTNNGGWDGLNLNLPSVQPLTPAQQTTVGVSAGVIVIAIVVVIAL